MRRDLTEQMTAAEYQAELKKPRSKYGNRICVVDGIRFHSKREAMRWLVLRDCERKREIRNLQRQVAINLIVKDKLICKLVIDFAYEDWRREKWIFEDAKGWQTPESKLKMKLAEALNPHCDWRLS